MKTKIAAVALAALTLAGGVAATTNQAEAQWRGRGAGFGIAAGLIAGAAIASAAAASQPAYVVDGGYRRCRFVKEYDGWGNYFRTVRVCKVYY
jgi:hypothetical protein